jgi:hypothetical protein
MQIALEICGTLGIITPDDDWLPIAAVILKLFLIYKYNSLTLECYKANYDAQASPRQMQLGKGLFLASSLISNSCDANTYKVGYGTSVVFRARRPIKKGEQITFCYMAPATEFSYEERQSYYLKEYKFKCW